MHKNDNFYNAATPTVTILIVILSTFVVNNNVLLLLYCTRLNNVCLVITFGSSFKFNLKWSYSLYNEKAICVNNINIIQYNFTATLQYRFRLYLSRTSNHPDGKHGVKFEKEKAT